MASLIQRIQARAKGLVELHPEVLDREHLLSVRSDAALFAPYNFLHAVADWEQHLWVRKAVKIVGDNLTALPLYVKRGADRLETHPLIDLLTTVNASMTSMDLWQRWAIDMLLGGETGWELAKSARGPYAEVWPRQPQQFNVIPNKARRRYFEVAGYEIDDGMGEPFTLPPEEFLHFKFYNPRNPWRGLSVMQAIRMSILIDTYAQAWEKFLFQNNARPDYAVVTPQGTTKTEREDIEKKLAQKFGGPANAGKPIVLEEGMTDVKILSFRPKDMSGLELRGMSRDEIAGMFGVPDILMGFGNDSYDTDEKRPAAIRALYSLTIKPLAAFRDGTLTEYFQRVNVLKANEAVFTDYSGVPELEESESDEWRIDREKIETGVITRNQYNAKHGYEAVPWGDAWWAPANLVPVIAASTPEAGKQAKPGKTVRIDPRHNGHSEEVIEIAELLSEAIETAEALKH